MAHVMYMCKSHLPRYQKNRHIIIIGSDVGVRERKSAGIG